MKLYRCINKGMNNAERLYRRGDLTPASKEEERDSSGKGVLKAGIWTWKRK